MKSFLATSGAALLLGRQLSRGLSAEEATRMFTNPEQPLNRVFAIEKSTIDKEKRTVEVSFSSEFEVKRWGMIEVLSHEAGAVDLTRLNDGAPLLFNHNFNAQLGVVESSRIDTATKKGRAVVRFGRSAEAESKFQDVQDGILTKISVGYRIHEVKLKETRDDGTDVYLATKWEPNEVSFVTVPADTTVGLGRSFPTPTTKPKSFTMTRDQLIALLKRMGINYNANATDAELNDLVSRAAAGETGAPPVNPPPQKGGTQAEERDRVRVLLENGKKYGLENEAEKAVLAGTPIDEFRQICLDAVNKRNAPFVKSSTGIGLSEKEVKNFSFIRLLKALSADGGDKNKAREEAAFEFEACRAAGENFHRSAKGTVIPIEVLMTPLLGRADAAVSIKTGSGYSGTGGNTVKTELLSQSFIELLRKKTTIMNLGTELGGLVGNIDIPKQLTGQSGFWLGEDASAGRGDVTFGLVSLRPKTVGSRAEITRKMLMQSSLGVEAIVRNDLIRGLAQTVDTAGFYGTGADDQPTGLTLQSGINAFDWATANSPTNAEIIKMETEIAADDADVESMRYVTTPRLRGYMKSTLKFSGVAGTIWEPGNTLNGYGGVVTNQLTAGHTFFGNWADYLIGLWGGLEITVDPYTFSDKGRIRVVGFQDVDMTIRRTESFCWCKNAT